MHTQKCENTCRLHTLMYVWKCDRPALIPHIQLGVDEGRDTLSVLLCLPTTVRTGSHRHAVGGLQAEATETKLSSPPQQP